MSTYRPNPRTIKYAVCTIKWTPKPKNDSCTVNYSVTRNYWLPFSGCPVELWLSRLCGNGAGFHVGFFQHFMRPAGCIIVVKNLLLNATLNLTPCKREFFLSFATIRTKWEHDSKYLLGVRYWEKEKKIHSWFCLKIFKHHDSMVKNNSKHTFEILYELYRFSQTY